MMKKRRAVRMRGAVVVRIENGVYEMVNFGGDIMNRVDEAMNGVGEVMNCIGELVNQVGEMMI